MLLDLSGPPANPSSVHWFGQQARNLLSTARQKTASFFRVKPDEIIFTSGGTESVNFFLRGLGARGHIITSAIEHSATYRTLQALEAGGLNVTYLPVGLWGAPLPEQVADAIRPDTRAIVLSASNGETGVKLDLESVAKIAETRGIPLFIDAVAYIGKELLLTLPKGVAGLSLSAHKFHGPKGIGALYLRSDIKLPSEITGGSQENQHRAGTENLAGILGLAEALQILQEKQIEITQTITDLRAHFEHGLRSIPDIAIHGEGPRISNTSNVAFRGTDGETLLMQLDLAGIAVSHGSACGAGSLEPSRVLTSMGIDRKTARSSIRFSLSRMNTREEIDLALDKIAQILAKLRKLG